jgi:hypothetical protein
VETGDVLELLTALTEKSLVVTEGDRAQRYRMLGTIKEYADRRLSEAWESDVTRRAHLAYFTELAATAEPHLRRAEQLEWLARLEPEHDNIAAAMRGALAAREADGAMRLAAAAGWYWWLGGHKAEGDELIMAAVALPGEVADEIRAVVLAFLTMFMTSGKADQYRAEQWIREAYAITQRLEGGHPALGFVAAMQRLLEGPQESLTAFEPLLTHEDPWARALARLQLGKMRIVLGRGDREADANLEAGLAEFRALGERWGISFALRELAERIAMRGEFARACDLLDQAVAVVAEMGSVEDMMSMRSRQAQIYWLAGDEAAASSAMAEAQRYAERVAWPTALAELAMARAEIARWRGDAEEARGQLGTALALMNDVVVQPHITAFAEDLLGYLAGDPGTARDHRVRALKAASAAAYPLLIAQVLTGVADQALRAGDHAQAARLLAAGDAVRGLPDRTQPDAARIERAARSRLGDTGYAEAAREGAERGYEGLVEVTLAS